MFRLPLCLKRFVDRVVRLTDVQNQSFRNVSHFYSFIRAGTEDDVSQLRRARQQTRGKKNARSDGAPGSRGIPQCQEDSCGTPGVTQSAGIFPDKIFLTERAVVFAQRAVACSTQDIRPCASFSSPFSYRLFDPYLPSVSRLRGINWRTLHGEREPSARTEFQSNEFIALHLTLLRSHSHSPGKHQIYLLFVY